MEKSWLEQFREYILNELPVGKVAKHFMRAKGAGAISGSLDNTGGENRETKAL